MSTLLRLVDDRVVMERKDAGEMEHAKMHMYRNKMDTANLTVQFCAQHTHINFMLWLDN
jgi:hypothetical protein